eukprot:418784_1
MGNKKSKHKQELIMTVDDNLCDTPTWASLSHIPFEKFGKPILIDNDNFVLVTSPSGYITKTSKKHQPAGIYKYNLSKQKWTQLKKFPKEIRLFQYADDSFTTIINENKNILYVVQFLKRYPTQIRLIKLDLHNAKLTINEPETDKIIKEQTAVMINNEFHFFSQGHIIWNAETNEWKKQYPFRDWDVLECIVYNRTPIYIKSKHMIYIFGGNSKKLRFEQAGCGYSTLNDVGTLDSIHTYSLKSKKMKKLNVKMPEKLSDFGIISCRKEKYILIFGGRVDDYFVENSNRIYIFNVEKNTFVQSTITMPFVGEVSAMLISSNDVVSKLLTDGFIRRSCKHIVIPKDIVNIIHSMICLPGCVHLIQTGLEGMNADKKHVSINVDFILKELTNK